MPRILLVDDDELLRGAIHQILVGAGYDVGDASNGRVAVREYRRQRCDVVIMDIIMPDEEGLGTIRELRRVDPNVKIIAISGGGHGKAADYQPLVDRWVEATGRFPGWVPGSYGGSYSGKWWLDTASNTSSTPVFTPKRIRPAG